MSTQALISARPLPDKNLSPVIKAFALGGMALGLVAGLVNLPAALTWSHLPLALKVFMTLFPLAIAFLSWRLLALRRWAAVALGSFMVLWSCGMLATPLPLGQVVLAVSLTALFLPILIVGRGQLKRGW